MADQQSSYRQIMKATSLFGGVQVFNILIQIIRSKVMAVLLGPAGMGIAGLLNSTTGFIGKLTNFGLETSAVKNVAEANGREDVTRISLIVNVLRRWIFFTGLLGSLLTLVLASRLSLIAFGSREYTLAFVWISITLLFNQLSSGQLVVLQGLRKLKYLANANLTGAVFGLLVSLPMYYFWGVDGIVPAILASSFINMLRSWYFVRKVHIKNIPVPPGVLLSEGREMLKMGFMISLSSMITLGASYLVRIYISHTGGIDQVGLYTAGFAIVNNYVGLVFTAMGKDYYPRLSAVSSDNQQSRIIINQQAEIAFLILAPIIILFLIFVHWIVVILYSTRFSPVNDMILWAATGMMFKAATWAIGFVFLAKGASKIFLFSEILSNSYTLLLNVLCYHFWGLTGMGISFLISYVLGFIQVFTIAHLKFEFFFHKSTSTLMVYHLLLVLLSLLCTLLMQGVGQYIAGSVLFLISLAYSFRELNKRLGLKHLLHQILHRNHPSS